MSAAKPILQIKVTLKHIRPPIWRRLLVHRDTPLDEMHEIIQRAMGWWNAHLAMFEKNREIYELPDPMGHMELEFGEDGTRYTIGQLLPRVKSKFNYVYDFGDNWVHEMLLEDRLPAEPDKPYPVCIKGKRACPPEDCGGPWGYGEMLEAVRDPKHPEHEELSEWLDEDFDPEAFDLEAVNAKLRRL